MSINQLKENRSSPGLTLGPLSLTRFSSVLSPDEITVIGNEMYVEHQDLQMFGSN